MVDKMPFLGGNSVKGTLIIYLHCDFVGWPECVCVCVCVCILSATGGINAAHTRQQRALGIQDSPESFQEDTARRFSVSFSNSFPIIISFRLSKLLLYVTCMCVTWMISHVRSAQLEVKDVSGAVIPGLFAAGEVAGGVHGANRFPHFFLFFPLPFFSLLYFLSSPLSGSEATRFLIAWCLVVSAVNLPADTFWTRWHNVVRPVLVVQMLELKSIGRIMSSISSPVQSRQPFGCMNKAFTPPPPSSLALLILLKSLNITVPIKATYSISSNAAVGAGPTSMSPDSRGMTIFTTGVQHPIKHYKKLRTRVVWEGNWCVRFSFGERFFHIELFIRHFYGLHKFYGW